jgi:replicative DNA helicase
MEDWERLTDAMVPIARSQIFIDATSGLSVPECRSKARRLQMEHGLDLILIDYLSLMTGTGKFNSRQEEVSGISRALKGLAQELQVPVKFVGLGEGIDDLQPFDAMEFLEAMI